MLGACALTTFSGLGWASALPPNPWAPPFTGPPVVPVAPVATPAPAVADASLGTPYSPHSGSAGLPPSAGRTPGNFAVSNSGAALYTIPLWTPAGVGAVNLDLALVYNSRGPNGVLGVGWTLAGLSAISRCNKTWAQDGTPAPVTNTMADRFCLDGEQLKSVSGVYGQAGSTYATEIESFARIVSNGALGNGPASFTVTSKNGLIYDYGLTSDAQIMAGSSGTVRTWALSKIRDRVGNAITLTYSNDAANGSYRIASITYPTTASGQGPFYRVAFEYGPRPANDVVSAYVAGYPMREPYQLNSIMVVPYASGSAIKSYHFTYDQGTASSRLRLRTVQECSASSCFDPTTVAYQNGQAGWVTTAASTGQTTGDASRVIAADMNGDGITDLVYPVDSGSSYAWRVMLADANGGFSAPQALNFTTAANEAVVAAAFSGRGRTELLYPSGGYWFWLYWNGTAFVSQSTGTPISGPEGSSWKSIASDINGDGLPDLIWVANDRSRPGTTVVYVNFNTTPAGGNVTFGAPTSAYEMPGTSTMTWTVLQGGVYGGGGASAITVADFNGDGRADLMAHIEQTDYTGCEIPRHGNGNVQDRGYRACNPTSIYYWRQLISTGVTFAAGPNEFPGVDSTELTALDWNGDGCTDMAVAGVGGSGNWTVYPAACGTTGVLEGGVAAIDTGIPHNHIVLAVDWDGDGRQDLLGGIGTWRVARSTGTGAAPLVDTGIAVDSGAWFPGDFNGDGLSDLGWIDRGAGKTLKVNFHAGAGTAPDLATAFTDGFGMNQSPTYVSLARGNYTRNSDAPFPYADFQGPLYVVDQFVASDGTGSSYQNQFWYFGAWVNLQGRGFAGFLAQRIYDTRNGLYTYDYVERTFPYTGMPLRRDVLQPNGSTYLRQWTSTLSAQALGSGYETRYFPYASAQLDDRYEFGGSLNGTLVTQSATSYAYGDGFGNPTQVATSVTDLDPTSPFYRSVWSTTLVTAFSNSTSDNCLGLPTSQSVTQVVPGQSTQTRTTGYGVDSGYCRVTSQVIEPSAPSLKVTTTFGFDGCGNVDLIEVVGSTPGGTSMPARSTRFGYGARCQLPELVTNALGQSTSFAYDYEFGVPTRATDANQLVTTWQYDDFGRRTLESRPDGTKTRWAFESCSVGPCWGVNDLRFLVYETPIDASGGVIKQIQRFYDGLDRLRYDEYDRVLGVWTHVMYLYDSLGRPTAEYNPAAVTGATGWHTVSYDVLNRPTAARLFQPSGALDRSTTLGYAGRTAAVTDPLGRTRTQLTDVVGHLRRVTDPAPGGTTSYDYDAFGNLNRVQDAIGAVSSGLYNLRGFRTQWADADRGAWTFEGNSLNELVGWTNARNQHSTAAYDALGRLVSRTEQFADAGTDVTSTWTWGASPAAHNIGRLQSVSGAGYAEALTYDAIARLAARVITTDQSYQYDYTYNGLGTLDTLTYPASPVPAGQTASRFRVQYGYSYGAPFEITDVSEAAPRTLWTLNVANDFSSPTSESLGAGVVSLGTAYNVVTNDVESIQSGAGGVGANRQSLSYQWDTVGNLTQRQDLRQGLTENFVPDALNRVETVTGNAVPNLTMSYDPSGNITSKSDVGAYTYDASHRHQVTAAGSNSYTYDADGNVATRNGAGQSWTSFNLPTTLRGDAEESTISYGPEHQRWQQVAHYWNGIETTHYAGGLLEKVASTVSGLTYWRHYVPTPGGTTVEVSRNSNGTISTDYLLTDHLGSTDAVLDGSGAFVLQESFDTFGKRRGSDWSAATPPDWTRISQTTRIGYTGQEMLDNVALVHMNGRVYDPAIGRFLSVDPLVGDLADSQSVNPYAYVGNRPLSYTDPTGNCLEAPGDIACTANSFISQQYVKGVLDLVADVLVISGVFGGSGHQPPPATTLPGQSAQRGSGVCGPGNTTPMCGGMILYASAPGTATGVPSSSWITNNDPYAAENVEQFFIDILNNSVDVLILGAYYDAKGAYDAVGQGNYGTAVVYIAFTLCDLGKPCEGLAGLKAIGRLASGLRKAERATATAVAKSLGANPFKGKTVKEIAEMLEKKGYTPRGPDPAAGRGTYVNPNTGRGYHIDANHPPPKGPHVGVHRPRDIRDTLPPRDYPLEGP